LTGLATDPRYLEWLSALGLSPSTMMQLSQGREVYINNYIQDMKVQMDDDIAWMQNLDKLGIRAEEDWNAKTRMLREEQARVQNEVSDDRLNSLNEEAAKVKILLDRQKLQEGVVGAVSKTGFIENSDGSVTYNNPLAGRVECGEWTNDALGTANAFGDTFESKKRNTPSATPIARGSFSVNIGKNGHCGLVEAVYADGSILVADTNRKLERDGVVKRDIIKPNENGQYILPGTNTPIAGFGAPPAGKTSEVLALYGDFMQQVVGFGTDATTPDDVVGEVVAFADSRGLKLDNKDILEIKNEAQKMLTSPTRASTGASVDALTRQRETIQKSLIAGNITQDEAVSATVAIDEQIKKKEAETQKETEENTETVNKLESQAANQDEIVKKESELKDKQEELKVFEAEDESKLKGYQMVSRRSKRNKLTDEIARLEKRIGFLKGELSPFGNELYPEADTKVVADSISDFFKES